MASVTVLRVGTMLSLKMHIFVLVTARWDVSEKMYAQGIRLQDERNLKFDLCSFLVIRIPYAIIQNVIFVQRVTDKTSSVFYRKLFVRVWIIRSRGPTLGISNTNCPTLISTCFYWTLVQRSLSKRVRYLVLTLASSSATNNQSCVSRCTSRCTVV